LNPYQQLYRQLHRIHGPQGWWPLLRKSGARIACRYHPDDYRYPKTSRQRFEIGVGAILTQNTNWGNVEKALINLATHSLLDARAILNANPEHLKKLIRPAGYFNQKTTKLRLFAESYTAWKGTIPHRDTLLGIWGIGPETCDSILLYAYQVPVFVIDAYTKRIFKHLGLSSETDYETLRRSCEQALPREPALYQEYHALLVAHAKRYYSKKPYGKNCPLQLS